jgi:hypothetical protein
MKTIVISGRRLEHMHGSQVEFVGRTIARALAGEDIDQRDLVPYGIKISVGPAAVLSAAADYLDDGFHAPLVADLRELVEGGELEE